MIGAHCLLILVSSVPRFEEFTPRRGECVQIAFLMAENGGELMSVIGRRKPLLCVKAIHAHKFLRLSDVFHAILSLLAWEILWETLGHKAE